MAHVPDATLRHIGFLSPDIQDAAYWLVYIAREAGFPLQITSTLRTRSEQASLVRRGRSNTLSSKHLIGQAFDVDLHGLGRDQVPLWFWDELGWLGEYLGLRWGGRWESLRDYGHFENPYSAGS